MLKIDAHQHFWKYTADMSSWITDDMAMLRRDFMPQDLELLLNQFHFDGCIAVQVNQTADENLFQLNNAAHNEFVKGVVGWVDLRAADLSAQLALLSQHKKLKGFRHILQGEEDRGLMLQADFSRGLSQLKEYGFTYDILIHADQLKHIPELLKRHPDQAFVLDHIAKPDIKNNDLEKWGADVKALAGFENLYCKVSGMVTEAKWRDWKQVDFVPYLDIVFDTFGTSKVMFGSDWPVCLTAAEYSEVHGIMDTYISKLTRKEQSLFWGENAIKFYNLN